MTRSRRHRARRSRKSTLVGTFVVLLLGAGAAIAAPAAIANWRRPRSEFWAVTSLEQPSLDGRGNNRTHRDQGRAGAPYSRVAKPNYADGRSAPVTGPNTRYISNRVFSDVNQNVFSERQVTQWGFVWGQFIDHTIGHRDELGTPANIAFNAGDPLEDFTNNLGSIPFIRSKAAPGTGQNNPREQINLIGSYINASAVYGSDNQRLEWLRDGPVDGSLRNNRPTLFLQNGLLPRRDARGNAATAPEMAVDGRLLGQPAKAMVAGDVRANENIGLTATQTLFAREHNRIVNLLPKRMSDEDKFQIARRVVIAEQQYITYREFLPAVGVELPTYRGYDPRVDTTVSNEFATVGYRAHSMIHGEIEVESDVDRYTDTQLQSLQDNGVEVELSEDGTEVELAVPLNVAFFNPELVGTIQLGPLLAALGGEAEYNNDEQIDNQLRSVMFQIAPEGNAACEDPENLDGPGLADCFRGVVDLGAIDVERGRDHGMPSYNDMRRAYNLAPKKTFAEITGEKTDAFPADAELTRGQEIDDPDSLDVTRIIDRSGKDLVIGSEEGDAEATHEVRRTPLAARLKAIYGSVDKVDAFVGMVAEPHLAGADMGELQLAMWKRQFQALRDGDRFFFGNDQALNLIRRTLGVDYRHTLAEIIALNTDIPKADLAKNVFLVNPEAEAAPEPAPAGTPAATATPKPTTAPRTPPAAPGRTPNRSGSPRSAPRRRARH